jgi:hypothetical protein
MEATDTVKIRSLEPYRHLFPKALVIDKTVKKGASVEDTVHLIPLVVKKTAWQVQDYVDAELKGLSTYDACKKMWDFVKYHIEYRPDKRGVEQVRSPRRLIHDGFGDCDCGTTFMLACLYVLRIPTTRRITKYKEDRFQHIYPVVPLQNGSEIIVDFVVPQFNYEEPYTEKKDYTMDLQFLDGIGENSTLMGVDANDLFGSLNDVGELGQLLRKAKKGGGGGSKPGLFKKKTPEQKKQKKEERKKKLLKVVNKVNKVNLGAALLRAGILASMKLNIMKVAERLKWAYATREQAESKGMDMSKYDKLKQILAKAEKIFYVSGGKPENLRKAIISGRGNRNHEVAGVDGYSESTSLNELLGAIYQDEFVNGIEGLSGDGMGIVTAAATTASITAATGTMAAIAALLKQVGSIFPKKEGEGKEKKERKGFFNRKSKSEGESSEEGGGSNSENSESSGEQEESSPAENESEESSESTEGNSEENLPATTEEESEVTTTEESEEEKPETSEEEGANGLLGLGGIKDFYQKNKKWIVPVGIAATAITLGLVINHYASKPETEVKPVQPIEKTAVNGLPGKKRRRRKGTKSGSSGKQSVIALM